MAHIQLLSKVGQAGENRDAASASRPAKIIPFVDFGGPGRNVVFLHANGYPPGCYAPLLRLIGTHYHCTAMLLRPLWPGSNPAQINDWRPLTDDLLRFMNERGLATIVGVGHSMGACIALRAALRVPERFTALVLLDPVLLPRRVMLEWWLARAFGLGILLHPLIRGTLKRHRDFADLEQIFDRYRRRPIFRHFSDENLRALVTGLTEPSIRGGYQLAYTPEWEARVYYTAIWNDWDLWAGIRRLAVPTLIIRGAETDTFRESTARAVQLRNPGIRIVTIEGATHLLPLERPQEVFVMAQPFLEEIEHRAA